MKRHQFRGLLLTPFFLLVLFSRYLNFNKGILYSWWDILNNLYQFRYLIFCLIRYLTTEKFSSTKYANTITKNWRFFFNKIFFGKAHNEVCTASACKCNSRTIFQNSGKWVEKSKNPKQSVIWSVKIKTKYLLTMKNWLINISNLTFVHWSFEVVCLNTIRSILSFKLYLLMTQLNSVNYRRQDILFSTQLSTLDPT